MERHLEASAERHRRFVLPLGLVELLERRDTGIVAERAPRPVGDLEVAPALLFAAVALTVVADRSGQEISAETAHARSFGFDDCWPTGQVDGVALVQLERVDVAVAGERQSG